jgi:hypothetical protein
MLFGRLRSFKKLRKLRGGGAGAVTPAALFIATTQLSDPELGWLGYIWLGFTG